MNLLLKTTKEEDLNILFLNQTDKEANRMAAFTAENPDDKAAYMEKWTKIVHNPQVNMQTIFLEGEIVGSVLHFDMMNETNVSYWIARKYWGKGIGTLALLLFLKEVKKRPLFGRTAFDNYGSQKVLQKCGFVKIGEEKGFANARKEEIIEFVYKLN